MTVSQPIESVVKTSEGQGFSSCFSFLHAHDKRPWRTQFTVNIMSILRAWRKVNISTGVFLIIKLKLKFGIWSTTNKVLTSSIAAYMLHHLSRAITLYFSLLHLKFNNRNFYYLLLNNSTQVKRGWFMLWNTRRERKERTAILNVTVLTCKWLSSLCSQHFTYIGKHSKIFNDFKKLYLHVNHFAIHRKWLKKQLH